MKRYTGYAKVEVPERWNGCLLVNPLCPDDLCWLPAKDGKQHRLHCLGTDRWDERFTIEGTAFYMSYTARNATDLIDQGWAYQLQNSPSEAEFRRQTMSRADYNRLMNLDTGRTPVRTNRSVRNPLISRSKYHRNPTYPCWCGESMVPRYRQMVVCCTDYLTRHAPHIYLDLDVPADVDTAEKMMAMNPEEIQARCEWLRERRQGDVPVWTSDQIYGIVSEYLRLLPEIERLRTGVR